MLAVIASIYGEDADRYKEIEDYEWICEVDLDGKTTR